MRVLAGVWAGGVLAQTAGSPTSPTSIATLIAQLGIGAIFFWLYRDKDAHAKRRDDQLIELTNMLVPIVTRATDQLERFERSVELMLRPKPPDSQEKLEAALQLLIQEMQRR